MSVFAVVAIDAFFALGLADRDLAVGDGDLLGDDAVSLGEEVARVAGGAGAVG